jgi:DNA double-strand break repair helicase HerA and related ATPase
VPDDVLAQLGSRVQHQLRAHTPNDAKALKQTVATFPKSHYDLSETLQQLGIGEAIVTVMDPDGAPTPVAWTRMRAPESLMAPTPDEVLRPGIAASALMAKYGQPLDRDSAHEILARKLQAGAEQAERERLEKDVAARAAADEKERQRAQAQAEREARAATRAQPRTPQRREKSMVEQITDSSAFKQFARTAGTEIVRSIFGTARRRRR